MGVHLGRPSPWRAQRYVTPATALLALKSVTRRYPVVAVARQDFVMTERRERKWCSRLVVSRGYATGSAPPYRCCCRTATCWRRRPAPASANCRLQRLSVVTLQGNRSAATNRRKRSLFTGSLFATRPKAIVHFHRHSDRALLPPVDPHDRHPPLPLCGDAPSATSGGSCPGRAMTVLQALAGLAPAVTPSRRPPTGGYWPIASRSHRRYRGTGRYRTAEVPRGGTAT